MHRCHIVIICSKQGRQCKATPLYCIWQIIRQARRTHPIIKGEISKGNKQTKAQKKTESKETNPRKKRIRNLLEEKSVVPPLRICGVHYRLPAVLYRQVKDLNPQQQ